MMGKLFEIAAQSNIKQKNEFSIELAKVIENLSLKYGLPYEIVLKKAVDVVNKRAEPFELDIKVPILKKDDNWEEQWNKVWEESAELIAEIKVGTNENVADEALDLIQVCIGILDKLEQMSPGIVNKSAERHLEKLKNRGWEFKNILKVGIEHDN